MKTKFLILFLIFILFAVVESMIIFNLNSSLLHGGVRKFGTMTLGGEMIGGPGGYTFAPELTVPYSKKFYIEVVQKNLWCTFGGCSPRGQIVAILGGWLQGENTEQPAIENDYNLYENEKVKSIVVVGDKDGRIVGIYPNKNIDDLLSILEIHHNLWAE